MVPGDWEGLRGPGGICYRGGRRDRGVVLIDMVLHRTRREVITSQGSGDTRKWLVVLARTEFCIDR